LSAVAQLLAEQEATTGEIPEVDELGFELRVAGVPQVWPRRRSAVGDIFAPETKQGFVNWLASFDDGGQRRCGLGTASTSAGRSVLTIIAVDALADLKRVPRRARVGQWLEVEAQLLEAASDAKVVVLGPRGAPRTVPTQLTADLVRARVAMSEPGPWLLQVLSTLNNGPRPVLEALVFVDEAPYASFQSAEVPGEHAGGSQGTAALALFAMLNASRRAEGLRPLTYDAALASGAASHAEAMRQSGRVAHDLGRGTTTERVQALGFETEVLGENVVRAPTVVRAHRTLWASPSHRSNMLNPRFTHAGIGMAEGPNGQLWMSQLFASFM
jgi:uncharacterized protein YkwD